MSRNEARRWTPRAGRPCVSATPCRSGIAFGAGWTASRSHACCPRARSAKAVGYLRNQWSALQVYLRDGRIPIDNDQSEQTIRPLTVGRSNWLFLGHPHAAPGRLQLYSIVSSAHRHHLVIHDYLEDVLRGSPMRSRTILRTSNSARRTCWIFSRTAGPRPILSPCVRSVSRRKRSSPTRSGHAVRKRVWRRGPSRQPRPYRPHPHVASRRLGEPLPSDSSSPRRVSRGRGLGAQHVRPRAPSWRLGMQKRSRRTDPWPMPSWPPAPSRLGSTAAASWLLFRGILRFVRRLP